jgi:hypothetical protein
MGIYELLEALYQAKISGKFEIRKQSQPRK